MATNAMKIGKAFCRDLGRTIDIQEAGINYFAQTLPRKKYSFYCSSPECEKLPIQVEILGVNYRRVPIDSEGHAAPDLADEGSEDDNPIVNPYFKTKPGHNHSDDCQWTIDQEAEQVYIDEADTLAEKKHRRQRVAAQGLIEETTFLLESKEIENPTIKEEPSDERTAKTTSDAPTNRRQRLDHAVKRIARPKRSPYFSALVSSYITVWEKKLFDEPLNVISVGETTWGHFFFPIEWYSTDNRTDHIFHGNARITTLPHKFDWSKGLPNAAILHFYDEVTVGETTAKPSFMITRKLIEANPGSYVLMEAIRSALEDDNYKNYLRCYFYGQIEEMPKKKDEKVDANNPLVLKIKPMRLDTLELRRVEIVNQ